MLNSDTVQTAAPTSEAPYAKWTATYTFAPVVTGNQLVPFRYPDANGSVTPAQPVMINVLEATSNIVMSVSSDTQIMTTSEYAIIAIEVRNPDVWGSAVDLTEWDPANVLQSPPLTTTVESGSVRYVEQQGEEPAKFYVDYRFNPQVAGNQAVTFTFDTLAESVTINVLDDATDVVMTVTSDKSSMLMTETATITVELTKPNVWASEIDTTEWDPSVQAPSGYQLEQTTVETHQSTAGQNARYVVTYTFTPPSSQGQKVIEFTHTSLAESVSIYVAHDPANSFVMFGSAPVAINIEADLTDSIFTSNERLFYHHYTADKSWNTIFSDVLYDAYDVSAVNIRQDPNRDGKLLRFNHIAGNIDVTRVDLKQEVIRAVNFYMTGSVHSLPLNLSSTNIAPKDGAYEGREYFDQNISWATMVGGNPTAHMAAEEIERFVEALGSAGRLKEGEDMVLQKQNILTVNDEEMILNLYVVYEVIITESDPEELHVQPQRTFPFYAGFDNPDDVADRKPPTDINAGTDASDAPRTGIAGRIRFKTKYTTSVD